MTRFEYAYPELAAELRRAPVEKLRAACLTACEYAVAQVKREHPLVIEALAKLRAGEVLAAEQKEALEALVEQLDREYFDLMDAFEEGRASMKDYRNAFAKARAAASVLYAFDSNPYDAAS